MPGSSVPSLRRASVVAVVVGAVLAGSVLPGGCSGTRGTSPPGASPRAASPADVPAARGLSRASAVLHRWDRARAAAFATGDPAALRRLYVPGSSAGTADVRTLRAYLGRGLRVERMRMQLLALEVLDERPGRLRLRVTDRLAGAVAVGEGRRTRLPADTASTRVLELVRGEPGWQVASVSEPGPT